METYIPEKKKTIEERVADLENKVKELEKENALMMRALAKLTEDKAGIGNPESSPS